MSKCIVNIRANVRQYFTSVMNKTNKSYSWSKITIAAKIFTKT